VFDCVLLGQDHADYGIATTVAVGDRAAASISVGSDTRSPSLRFKGSSLVPNEDALCIVDGGDRVVIAAADAHFGHESSHVMIDWLHASFTNTLPTNAVELRATIEGLGHAPDPETDSESTLVVALFDRVAGHGWVVNYGDSSLVVVTGAGEYRQVNLKDERYVATGDRWPAGSCSSSAFSADPGDTLLMFTDGVDECHYRHPLTSVRPDHIAALVDRVAGHPADVSRALVSLALAGVDGHPGGQDNSAIIVAMV